MAIQNLRFWHIVFVFLFLGQVGEVCGAVLFHDDFDAHPIGASIDDLTPQVGPNWRTTVPRRPENAYISDAGDSDRELTITSGQVSADFESTARSVRMTFELHVPIDTRSTDASFFLTSPGVYAGIDVYTDHLLFNSSRLEKPDTAGSYNCAITLHFDTNEVEIWIDDLDTVLIGDAMDRMQIPFSITHLTGFELGVALALRRPITIDNLTVVSIPEPNSSLLAFGMLLLYALLDSHCRSESREARNDARSKKRCQGASA
jgi:hypothetical protein